METALSEWPMGGRLNSLLAVPRPNFELVALQKFEDWQLAIRSLNQAVNSAAFADPVRGQHQSFPVFSASLEELHVLGIQLAAQWASVRVVTKNLALAGAALQLLLNPQSL